MERDRIFGGDNANGGQDGAEAIGRKIGKISATLNVLVARLKPTTLPTAVVGAEHRKGPSDVFY